MSVGNVYTAEKNAAATDLSACMGHSATTATVNTYIQRIQFSQNGAVAGADRLKLSRAATNGTIASFATVEKLNTRSPANETGWGITWSVAPTIATDWVTLGMVRFSPAGTFNMWWTPPCPRFPLQARAGDDGFRILLSTTLTNTANIHITHANNYTGGYGIIRGRRSTRPGYSAYHDNFLSFRGAVTTPLTNIQSSNSLMVLNVNDWPKVVPQLNINLFPPEEEVVTVPQIMAAVRGLFLNSPLYYQSNKKILGWHPQVLVRSPSQLFTQALAGALSFAGALVNKPLKVLTGVLSFSGSLLKKVFKPLSGSITPSGALTKITKKILSGVLSFSGAIATSIFTVAMYMAAIRQIESLPVRSVLAYRNIRSRLGRRITEFLKSPEPILFFQAVSGALSFVGGLTKKAKVTLFTGHANTHILTEGNDFIQTEAGGINDNHILKEETVSGGGLSFSGTVTSFITLFLHLVAAVQDSLRRTINNVSIAVEYLRRRPFISKPRQEYRPLGALFLQALTGAVSFSGTLIRKTKKVLSGVISPSGILTKFVRHILSGVLTFTGALIKKAKKILSGGVSFIGALTTLVNVLAIIAMAAIRPMMDAIAKNAVLASKWLERRHPTRFMAPFYKAPLNFFQSLVGTLSFIGTLTKKPRKVLAGTLSFLGVLTKKTFKTLAGSISFLGTLVKKVKKIPSGVLSFVGTLASSVFTIAMYMAAIRPNIERAVRQAVNARWLRESRRPFWRVWYLEKLPPTTFTRVLTGVLSFAGVLTRKPRKQVTGAITPTGSIVKRIRKLLSGSIGPVGTLIKKVRKSLAATLTFTGTLIAGFLRFVTDSALGTEIVVKSEAAFLQFRIVSRTRIVGKFYEFRIVGKTFNIRLVGNVFEIRIGGKVFRLRPTGKIYEFRASD